MSKRRHSDDEDEQEATIQDTATDKPLIETSLETKDRRFRDLYKHAPDFKQLARLDPDFAKVYGHHSPISNNN